SNSTTGVGLSGQTLAFSISGVGNFTNCGTDTTVTPNAAPGTENLGTSVSTTSQSSGYAAVCVFSTKTGTSSITVTNPGGLTVTGTLTFATTPDQARNIALSPKSQSVQPGTSTNVTAKVTDRFGNGVRNVDVVFPL